jgi:hypothetical protein
MAERHDEPIRIPMPLRAKDVLAVLTDPGPRGTIATCVAAVALGVALALITT